MLKVYFILLLVLFSSGCSVEAVKSARASVYADKEYICSSQNLNFQLEGSSDYQQGYIRVNDSNRIQTHYQDAGVESTWYWGAYVNETDTVLNNTRYKYKLVITPTGEGVYYNKGTDTKTILSCKANT